MNYKITTLSLGLAFCILGYAYDKKCAELADLKREKGQAESMIAQWDSTHTKLPISGYAGFLHFEAERKNALSLRWIKGNTFHYWNSPPTTLGLAAYQGTRDAYPLLVLDSADYAYFHKKALSRISIEQKQAVAGVNKEFETLRKIAGK